MEVVVTYSSSLATMLAAIIGFYMAYSIFKPRDEQYLGKIPWVGRRREWFAPVRANLRSVKQMHAMAFEGYIKFSKQGNAFAIPSLQTGPMVMLPPTKIHDHLIQPDTILDHKSPQNAFLHSKYTISDDRIMKKTVHFDIIRRQLTRRLPFVTKSLHEELSLAFDEIWGKDTDNWSEISAMRTCMKIVSRTSNRVFVGAPLCRNDDFLQSCELYAQGIFAAAAVIDQTPIWLRPFVGPLVAAPNKRNIDVAIKLAKPVIEERLRHIELKTKDRNCTWEAPDDFLQWQINESYQRNDPEEREPELIVRRLMMVNMVAIHTSTMTMANAILDIWSSDPSDAFVEGLREECSRILREDDGIWTKGGVDRMLRVDSAIKESMRLSSIVLTALPRLVTASEGVNLGHGLHIPHGAQVCFPVDPIHLDADFYPNPDVYDAFRFSRNRETSSLKLDPENHDVHLILKLKKQSMVAVDDHFLAFGHGRHACLGRFFASTMIKLMLSYVVENYDVRYMNKRVKNTTFFGVSFPPSSATVAVRRREM